MSEKTLKVIRRPFADDKLTPAEERVATLSAQGYSLREVAVKVDMSSTWVAGRLQLALARLGLKHKRELTRLMVERFRDAATR